MQGWHYGKRTLLIRPIFQLVKLVFFRASALKDITALISKFLNLKTKYR